MQEMVNAFIEAEPDTQHVFKDYQNYKLPNGTQGTHQVPKEILEFYDADKHLMNIDTLTDFYIIALADMTISNCKESVFTQIATLIRQAGKEQLCKILHGFNPTRKSFIKNKTH